MADAKGERYGVNGTWNTKQIHPETQPFRVPIFHILFFSISSWRSRQYKSSAVALLSFLCHGTCGCSDPTHTYLCKRPFYVLVLQPSQLFLSVPFLFFLRLMYCCCACARKGSCRHPVEDGRGGSESVKRSSLDPAAVLVILPGSKTEKQ